MAKAKPTANTSRSAKATPIAGLTKLDQLVTLLGGSDGATLHEMMAATGWQQHSVRGAIAGSLRKRGHNVVSTKVEGIRRYRIEQPA